MRFENTRDNLDMLESLGRPVRAEELYELLCLVMDEVYSAGDVLDAADLVCEDKARLAHMVRYVMGDAAKAADASMEGIRELSVQGQKEYQDILREAKQTEAQLEEVSHALREAEEARARKERAYDQLKKEQAALVEAQEDCKRIQEEIDVLSDAALEEKKEERSRLRSELAERKQKDANIQKELDSLEQAIDGFHKKLCAAEAEKEAAVSKRGQLERRLKKTKDDIENAEKKAAEVSAFLGSLNEKETALLALSAEYTTLFTALNAAMNEPFLCGNLCSLSGGRLPDWTDSPDLLELGQKIETAEDLKRWMEAVQARIEALISAYQTVLRRTAELSGSLTAKI